MMPAHKRILQPQIFPDRFDPNYLQFLLSKLDPTLLVRTAVPLIKEIEQKNGKEITLEKCIQIDFCGFASNTLLGNPFGRGSGLNDKKKIGEVGWLRSEIQKAFEKVFSRDFLEYINKKKSTYLKVRFCFAYLHSDFPVCLMKAEQQKQWKDTDGKRPYNFEVSLPLNRNEFNNSKITQSQKASLSKIIEIIKGNEDLIIIGGKEKKKNTVQVRFSIIPSPLCTLIVNNFAFCGPYLYSKIDDDPSLSVHYPISVLEKKRDMLQFESVARNFEYIWRHDLTLFCSDATDFTPNKPEGLININEPFDADQKLQIKWDHKQSRILEKIKNDKKKNRGIVYDSSQKQIEKWRNNLNRKLVLNTQKIEAEDKKDQTIKNQKYKNKGGLVSIHLGKDDVRKFYRIVFHDLKIEISKTFTKEGLFFFDLLHNYSYALKHEGKRCSFYDKNPNLYRGAHFYNEVKKQIKNNMIPKNKPIEIDKLFDTLFHIEPIFGLKIKSNQIFIDEKLGTPKYIVD